MVMLSTEAAARVRNAIIAAERNTDAEFVAVLAREADAYRFVPTLWAALLCLPTPLLLMNVSWWLTAVDLLILQIVVFVVLALLFRIPGLKHWLVPDVIKVRRAEDMAVRQFLEQGVHRTAQGFGVLFFVAEAEHHVRLIADHGIDRHVDQKEWQQIVDGFVARVKRGETEAGFLEAVSAVGAIMQRVAPATHTRDELSNHLILL
jgi:putative membrane protein